MTATEERKKTGEICVISGTYYCMRHPRNNKEFHKGQLFPPCAHDEGHNTVWILINVQ